jgi:uncharacterized protein YbjQ (UPF0145 family)
MKSIEISRKHGFDPRQFDDWLKQSGYKFQSKLMSIEVDESQNIDEIAGKFKAYSDEQNQLASERSAAQQQEAAERNQKLAGILITSGFNFEGHTITKYSGYISGDDAIEVNRPSQGFFGGMGKQSVGASLMASLVQIRRNALTEMKEAALALGCNAIIGVDFDYLTLDPETASNQGGTLYLPYVFGVTANGNAVIIEKNDRTGGM